MTTLTTTPEQVAPAGLRLTLPRVVRGELRKILTSRSTWWTSGAILLGMVGFGLLTSSNAAVAATGSAAVSQALSGSTFLVLVVAALGAVVGAREFGSGMIRTTLAAVPRRGTLVTGKALALVLVVLPVAVVSVLAAVAVAGAGPALTASASLGILVGTVAYLTAASLLGLGIGLLLRSTAGAVSTVIAGLMVLPMVASLALPSGWEGVASFLPSSAGAALTDTAQTGSGLTPAAGAAVLAAWVLAALVGAVVALDRRDA